MRVISELVGGAGSATAVFALMHPAGDEGGELLLEHPWHAWTFEPVVVLLLAVAAIAYIGGIRRLWRAAGAGHGISRLQAAAFAIGWLAVFTALVSPVDAVSSELFSVHMIQHELLMIVAAPLLVFGSPLLAFLWIAGADRPGR
jgi:cytochrome c oxidase assembly factor CtaG